MGRTDMNLTVAFLNFGNMPKKEGLNVYKICSEDSSGIEHKEKSVLQSKFCSTQIHY
jgi:hypothetical protein